MKKTSKLLAFFLTLCMVISLAACDSSTPEPAVEDSTPEPVSSEAAPEPSQEDPTPEPTGDSADKTAMTPGTYTITTSGMNAGLVVEVTLGETTIDSVTVSEHGETAGVSDGALAQIPDAIVAQQSIAVDAVAGATMTSNGIKDAVGKAIEEAGGVPAEFMAAAAGAAAGASDATRPALGSPSIPTSWDMSYDVVVVGGGFAGLSAAHSAKTNGADNVALVEKMPVLGGNSQINGGVYAAYTSKLASDFQSRFNLDPDTAEKHIEDTIIGGDLMPEPALVANMVYGSPFYLDMLLDNGLEVRDSLTRPGGHYGYRTYTTINGVGSDITEVQKKMVNDVDVEVLLNTEMIEIYRETTGDQAVVGIKVTDETGAVKNIQATSGVVIATGGFAANTEMRQLHVPNLTPDYPTTNHVGATGEGIKIAQEIGANTVQMSYIQLYPFADPNNGILDAHAVIPFSGPSAGVVYVDINGERYVNEGERRDVCAQAAFDSVGFPTFCIAGERIIKDAGFVTEDQLAAGIAADRIFVADTLEELAAEINARTYAGESVSMDGATLAQTIANHNTYVNNKEDPQFGKVIDDAMMTIEEGPYYAIPQWPSVHHTMGGLNITPKTEVRDVWGDPIANLYAAGEVTGGVHGTNRLGSNAVADAVSHGYIAGQMAADRTLPQFAIDAGNG